MSCKIIISQYVNSPVSKKIIAFMRKVIRAEKLNDWKIKIWSCDGEGECDIDLKRINIGMCTNIINTQRLLLHEISHALSEPYYHNKQFIKTYEMLQKKYSLPIDLRI